MQSTNPIRLVELTRSFYYGGTEVQLVELLRGLPSHYQVRLAALEAVGPLMEAVSELGHCPETFPLMGSAARVNTALQIGRLALWLRQQRTELVHVHDFYATLLAVPAAKLAGCKVIVGRLDLAHWHGKARRAVLAQLTRMADHVIANADAIRSMLIRDEQIPAERISVIHNGLDVKRFDQRQAGGLQAPLPEVGDAPVILHVANMNHPVKRQEDLLTALTLIREKLPKVRAFLVGDGPRRAQLEAQAKKMGLEGVVHFLGHRRDVPALYGHATLGVLCSNAEGLSNAVMEGMAAGLPMVVTSVGGNPELVEDGKRGHVVPPHQPQALAAALLRLLEDPAKARKMGKAARRFVEQQLGINRMIQAHDEVYRRVLGRPEPAPSARAFPLGGSPATTRAVQRDVRNMAR